MGSGAARTLEGSSEPAKPLDPELHAKLTAALDALDARDPDFKVQRDDTRFAQRVKMWNQLAKEVDGHLRTLGNVLNASHQLSLDIGSDGGGYNTKPWMEETSKKWERVFFKLEEGDIVCFSGNRTISRVKLEDLDYDWVEKCLAEWVVGAVKK